jgi:hypothetical protein
MQSLVANGEIALRKRDQKTRRKNHDSVMAA